MKYAMITGASSGIGREFARQLARKGYSLILVARRGKRLEKLAQELVKYGCQTEIIAAVQSVQEVRLLTSLRPLSSPLLLL